jgi:hypothetical protein
MIGDRDSMMARLGGFQDDVTADLMNSRVLSFPAQDVSEAHAGDVREGSTGGFEFSSAGRPES